MKYDSIFDVVGRIMVGPSSSHTAGACRIGYVSNIIFGGMPLEATIYLHGSFAETYRGHRSDVAIIGGLLGFKPDDERIPFSFQHAKEKTLNFKFEKADLGPDYHPNSIKIIMKSDEKKLSIVGSSIGGGNILIKEIDGLAAGFDADSPTIVEVHDDIPGVLANIASVVSLFDISISEMHLSRNIRKKIALSWIELTKPIPNELISALQKIPEMREVRALNV